MTEQRPPSVQSTSEQAMRAVTIGELVVLAGPVTLVAYDPAWVGLFEREAERIRSVLSAQARLLEHVGSTSVPGLAAKPVIDIVLAVPDSSDEGAYVPPMEAAGYVLRIREPAWFEHRLFKGPDTAVNVHVFTERAGEIGRMIAFRDWLRSHDDERQLYERTKRDLAARDWRYVQHYADAKTEVVAAIMARALAERQDRMPSPELREAIAVEQKRMAHGERPRYHVTCAPAAGGAVDVRVAELPIVHLFVPDAAGVLHGARVLIARTLGVDPMAFDVASLTTSRDEVR